MLLVDNLGATGGHRVNLSPLKVKLITFPLFLPEGNAILPMAAKTVCDSARNRNNNFSFLKKSGGVSWARVSYQLGIPRLV